jgi:hypothetical protein
MHGLNMYTDTWAKMYSLTYGIQVDIPVNSTKALF